MRNRQRSRLWRALAAVALCAGCGSPTSSTLSGAAFSKVAAVISAPEKFDCRDLQVGIYWFGKGNQAERATRDTAGGSRFYDPRKPTVIHTHGWAKDAVAHNWRQTFIVDGMAAPQADSAAPWIDAGWNVGIFYWTQLADADEPWSVEAKIWSGGGPDGGRWRQCDGSFAQGPQRSVTEDFVAAIGTAMAGYQGPELRLTGWSLGAQVVVAAAQELGRQVDDGQLPDSLRPRRVALLDPFWTTGNAARAWPGQATRETIEQDLQRPRPTAWEVYRTSAMLDLPGVADRNLELRTRLGELRYNLDFLSGNNPAATLLAQHNFAPHLYFLSFAAPLPRGCRFGTCAETLQSAAQPTAKIVELMHTERRWREVGGQSSPFPALPALFDLAPGESL